ncbi:dienelactone hydrolase family protein [Aliifodinibius sp. S!AR15-10]|uniref:dienelactone hydrolase family protein n=1 Tax=Aliifodinibius sp. S!AR15-10 TaxID=2950437 RepID=UPI0028548AD4|nr:dienelactone hydrolase family protein [Aliifodinibius sp. S!AR15-10]MDR8393246.1 dienelactone hydrolase family protein [Aliifodinibius sp. S!AR15-10]
MYEKKVKLPVDGWFVEGDLVLPVNAGSIIIFSGAVCRYDPQANQLARYLNEAGFGTLLFNLMTTREVEGFRRQDIDSITERLLAFTLWIHSHSEYRNLEIGYMGLNIGGAVALRSAGELGKAIKAVVTQGARTDLALGALSAMESPTLLIVGELDFQGLTLNQKAFQQLKCKKQLVVIPGGSHSLPEPGKLEQAGKDATTWFKKHMSGIDSEKPLQFDIPKGK